MSQSLQDQLLKAGLVDEKSVKKAAKDKRKQRRQQKGGASTAKPAETERQSLDAANKRRDRELNMQRDAAHRARERDAQVKQIIASHVIPLEEGDAVYNFADGGKVKKLYMTESTRARIARGDIAILKNGEAYVLVPAEIAARVEERTKERVLVFQKGHDEPAVDEDPYAEFQVPDDLKW